MFWEVIFMFSLNLAAVFNVWIMMNLVSQLLLKQFTDVDNVNNISCYLHL